MPSENYKILRVLNTKGTVHLAADNDGNKFVLKALAPDSVSMYRRIAELPPHEGCERVFECFENGESVVAVCGYIEGKTLREMLESGRTFAVRDIKRLICDLCDAVQHLHKNGIIHRDINPNNIILDDRLNLKLIDYGIARLYSGKRDSDTTIFGTEGYSAPEQYGFRETRFTADVYSIGMVLKMLLNSCADGSAAEEVQLRRIAAKCTAFDPDGRYKSASAVRGAIKHSGYILPAVIGVLAFAFAAVFLMGQLMASRDAEEVSSDAIGTVQTTSEVTTASAAASTAASTTTTAATATTTAVTTTTSATTSVTTTTTAETTATTTPTPVTTAATTTTATTKSATAATTATKATTTTSATTKATTTAAEQPVFQYTEYLNLLTLKGSDLNNPNMIEITSVQDENGHYYDSFEYEFFDDPAVHGEWVFCNAWSLDEMYITATAEGIINHEFWGESIIDALTINDNGTAELHYIGNSRSTPLQWTNGYLISENGDGIFAERLFVSVFDDVEFLFLEFKSGDYAFRGEINCYYIFTRKGFEAVTE